MSNAGQVITGVVGTVIGGTIGFVLGGPAGAVAGGIKGSMIGASFGLSVGGLLFPPSVDSFAQTIASLNLQTSQMGLTVPVIYGSRKCGGNMIWMNPMETIANEEPIGKGGSNATSTTYTYRLGMAWGVCMSPANNRRCIVNVWANGDLVDPSKYTVHGGSQTDPDLYIEAHQTGRVPVWKNLCYIVFQSYDLGSYPQIPQFTFEVGRGGEAAIAVGGAQVLFSPWWWNDNDEDLIDLGMVVARYDVAAEEWHLVGDTNDIGAPYYVDPPCSRGAATFYCVYSDFNYRFDIDPCGDEHMTLFVWDDNGNRTDHELWATNWCGAGDKYYGTYGSIHDSMDCHDNGLIACAVLIDQDPLTTIGCIAIKVSVDKGRTWKGEYRFPELTIGYINNLPIGGNSYGVRLRIDTVGVIWVCYSDAHARTILIYKSTDAGDSYSLISTIAPTYKFRGYFKYTVDATGQYQYMTTLEASGAPPYLYYSLIRFSDDFGATWTINNVVAESTLGNARTVEHTSSGLNFAGGYKKNSIVTLQYSSDAAETLTNGYVPVGAQGQYVDTQNEGAICAYTECAATFLVNDPYIGFLYSIDHGVNWRVISSPFPHDPLTNINVTLDGVDYGVHWWWQQGIDVKIKETCSVFDVLPTCVSRDVLTNDMYGLGLDESYLNEDAYTATASYCVDNNLLVSMMFGGQASVLDVLRYIISHHNGYIAYKDGKIEHNQLDYYTPTIAFTKENADFVEDKEFPIEVFKAGERGYNNKIQVEYTRRNKGYSAAIMVADDVVDIDAYRLKDATVKLDGLCKYERAEKMAWLLLKKSLIQPMGLKFKLGPKSTNVIYPGLIALFNDPSVEVENLPIRIITVGEDAGKTLSIEAMEENAAIYNYDYMATATPPIAPSYDPPNFYAPAESVQRTVAFKLPPFYAGADTLVMVVSSKPMGNPSWAGASVYMAYSAGGSYARKLSLSGSGVIGDVTSVEYDSLNVFEILSITVLLDTDATLSSAISYEELVIDMYKNLFYVDGKGFVKFQTVELVAAQTWKLTVFIWDTAGTMGSEDFVEVGDVLVIYQGNMNLLSVLPADIGKTLYFKTPSFNFAGSEQSLADVDAISLTV